MLRRLHLNRTQLLVLGFFALAWISLVAILVAAPEIYDQALQLSPDNGRLFDFPFLAAVSAFIVILAVGVLRRRRWTFWLVVVAFILGVLRVPASILQLVGLLSTDGPAWYTLL